MAYYHDYLAVEFGAYPHEGDLMDRLWERSPCATWPACDARLLLHGENDNDVPIMEAEQFYIALQEVGVPTEWCAIRARATACARPRHQVDALERSIAWYERWFTQPRPEPRPLAVP